MTVQGYNIADRFPNVLPKMSLERAIAIRSQDPVRCWQHDGFVEGMDAIATLRYGCCLACAKLVSPQAR